MSVEANQTGDGNINADVCEEQGAGDDAVFPDLKLGKAWGESITKGRAAELGERLQVWEQEADHGEWKGPFDRRNGGLRLTGADVFWLAARVMAGISDEQTVATMMHKLRQTTQDDIGRRLGADLSALHLEGADLSGAYLKGATLRWAHLTNAVLVGANLERAILYETRLEYADLTQARLKGANFSGAKLQRASLFKAQLQSAHLSRAQLERVELAMAHLEGADLSNAQLQGALLASAYLQGASFSMAHLEGADLSMAHLEGVSLAWTHLEEVTFAGAYLQGADLIGAQLQEADLTGAQLQGASFYEAHLEQAKLASAHLEGMPMPMKALARVRQWKPDFPALLPPADLRLAFLDRATMLTGATVGNPQFGSVRVADARWGEANLAVVDWSVVTMLGDERAAHMETSTPRAAETDAQAAELSHPERKQARQQRAAECLLGFQDAARANRQLATALRTQGITDEADRFAYRAQVCQRGVHLLRGRILRWLFSWLLFVIAGYGYRPLRTLFWYLAVIGAFAVAYFQATHGALTFGLPPSQIQPLAWYEALVLSVSSFHGRGFFQPVQSLGDPVAILAAIEAMFGLFIEVSFIATFTQRYFGK